MRWSWLEPHRSGLSALDSPNQPLPYPPDPERSPGSLGRRVSPGHRHIRAYFRNRISASITPAAGDGSRCLVFIDHLNVVQPSEHKGCCKKRSKVGLTKSWLVMSRSAEEERQFLPCCQRYKGKPIVMGMTASCPDPEQKCSLTGHCAYCL
jgi:hypothetical protein